MRFLFCYILTVLGCIARSRHTSLLRRGHRPLAARESGMGKARLRSGHGARSAPTPSTFRAYCEQRPESIVDPQRVANRQKRCAKRLRTPAGCKAAGQGCSLRRWNSVRKRCKLPVVLLPIACMQSKQRLYLTAKHFSGFPSGHRPGREPFTINSKHNKRHL